MNIKIYIITGICLGLLFFVAPALAHVVVRPNEVGVATFQTFTIGVPNEKDNPTIGLRLVLPEGLQHVSPNVKPGWAIENKGSEINWTGGVIPAGQRDEFLFSAQVPATEIKIQWKSYQTYQDGSVVLWDQDPESTKNLSDEDKEKLEKEGKGSYSETKIVNDLKPSEKVTDQSNIIKSNILGIVAIALACLSLISRQRQIRHMKGS